MKTTNEVKIIQPIEGAAVSTEILATSIVAISEGVKKLLAGPLAHDTLVLLIQDAAPSIPSGYLKKAKVGQREIKAVLAGIEALAKTHLKPKKP